MDIPACCIKQNDTWLTRLADKASTVSILAGKTIVCWNDVVTVA